MCMLKNDMWPKEGKFGVESAVFDLHAADVHYHQERKTNFLLSSYPGRLAKTTGNDLDVVPPCVI